MDAGRTPLTHLTDEQIVDLFWHREESAIRAADEKYGRRLLQLAGRFLSDPADCEECRNDAYLAAWEAIPPARPKLLGAFLATILRRIAINRYYAEHRRRGRVPPELTVSMEECAELFSAPDPVGEALDERELGAAVNAFLGTLTPRQRYVFMARFWGAESVRDIAGHLRVTESAVYKELAGLRQSLKRELQRKGVLS